METTANTLIETYGWLGVLIVLLAAIAYLIWKEHTNQKGKTDDRKALTDAFKHDMDAVVAKIDAVSTKVDIVKSNSDDRKDLLVKSIDTITARMDHTDAELERIDEAIHVVDNRVDTMEDKMHKCYAESKNADLVEAKKQTSRVLMKSKGGMLTKSLRRWCNVMGADHVYIAQFHNGTTDLRGIHFVKFDVITDEFADPLHLAKGDVELTPLYRNQYIVAYGDIAYTMCHIPAAVFDVNSEEFLNQSDALYRRMNTIGANQTGFAMIRDNDGEPIGWLGALAFGDKKIDCDSLEKAAREVENIFNTTDYD
jgi:hypothetical protein